MAQAGTVWVDVRGDTSKFVKDVGDAAKTAGRSLTGSLGAGARTVLGDLGTSAGVAAVGIGVIGGAAVKASTEFNKSMSSVSAVAGATAGELEKLREAALQAGADTAFSASEAAAAQGELVRAGVSVNDVLGGALTGTLGLAAAGQLDLAKAAEISAQALNIFDLAGSETTRVADTLAAGANKSAADVTQLGDALRQGGLVAAQAGLSLEETVGVLSLFADNALIGSDAGTSFKTFLQRLVPQSGDAAQAMEELNLKFFDAKGAFVGIDEVAGQLQRSLGSLSDEQRQNALTTLFGSDAVRAASILMDGGAASVREYTSAVNDQGAASRMAAEQLNNLAGDIEEFKGSTETALIRVGDLFDGVNRSIVQSGTEVVNVFNDFATTPAWGAIQRNLESLAAVGGGSLQAFADTLSDALGSVSAANVDDVFATVEGGLSKIGDAASGLEPVIAGLGLSLGSLGAASVLGPLGGIVPVISPITGILGGLVLGSEQGRDALQGLAERAGEFATGAGVDLLASLSDLAGELSDGLGTALADVGDAVFDAADALGPVLAEAIDQLGPPLADLIEAGGQLVSEVLPVIASLAGDVIPPAVAVLSGAIGLAADATGFLADNLELLAPALGVFVGVKYASQIGGIASAIQGAGQQALFLKDSIGQIAATQGVSKLDALRGVAKSTGAEAGGLASTLVGGLNPAVVGVTAAVAVGTIAYQNYAENKKRVAEASDSLSEALRAEADEFDRVNTEAARGVFAEQDAVSVVNELGQSLGDLVSVTATYGEEVRTLDDTFVDYNTDIARFRGEIETLPGPVREIGESVADLVDSGAIDKSQALDFFQALDELAQGSAESIGNAKAEFESLAREAAADGAITAEQLTAALDAIANADTPEELNEAFNLLQGFLGGTADEARRAANEILGLLDKLQELTGATRDVDQAERDLKDSFDGVLRSFGEFGAGIDSNSEAGRRNADAIQQAVESAEALAEAQAKSDLSGESSRQTLQNLADQLLGLRDAGLLTAEEYQRLLDLYDLTPRDIQTTINAETGEAQVRIAQLRYKIEDLPGVSEPVRANLLAQFDQGNFNQVEASLAFLTRQREAVIRVNPVLPPNSILQNFGIFNPGGVRRRAIGGPTLAGETFLAGENGPELVTTTANSRVLTASQTAGALGGALADTKGQSGSEFGDAMLAQIASEMRAQTRLLAGLGGTVVDVRAESGVRVSATQRQAARRSGSVG